MGMLHSRVSKNKVKKIGILDHTSDSIGGAQLVVASMAEVLSGKYEVEIIHSGIGYNLESLSSAFSLDLSNVNERIIESVIGCQNIPGENTPFDQIYDSYILSRRYDLFIYSGHSIPPFCFARKGITYCHFPMGSPIHFGLENNQMLNNRNILDRHIRNIIYKYLWRIRMKGYDKVLVNSEFTYKWVLKRFGRTAIVVYPPVEPKILKTDKKNIIISIGRFTSEVQRSKNQHMQLVAFREFLQKSQGKWLLHMVGSCTSEKDRVYLDKIIQESEGMPVKFSINVNRDEVCKALGEATFFWHSCGLFTDEAIQPYLTEHFGIATVEAMRAGCIPIVISSGGQPEIIEQGISGYLCKDMNEIVNTTLELENDYTKLIIMNGNAICRSKLFNRNIFDINIQRIISDIMN